MHSGSAIVSTTDKSPLIVIPASDDDEINSFHCVDQTVLVVNSAWPVTSKVALQRLWLTNAFKRRAEYFLDESVDSLEKFSISFLKPKIVRPCRFSENQPHVLLRQFTLIELSCFGLGN